MSTSSPLRRAACALAFASLPFSSSGCAPQRTLAAAPKDVARAPSAAATLPPADVSVEARVRREAPRARPELGAFFEAERVAGTIALFDSEDGVLSCSDVALCQKAVLPASTFKIPNSMIALETGVVDDAESLLPWDGKQYRVPEWNQDNTLRSAFRVSCLPCYQALARKVGLERMQNFVTKFDYGNHDVSGGVDRFWLWGGLRISPLQQIDFLRRFDAGKLPISVRTAEIVRDIMTLDVGPEHVLRGKTGLAEPPEEPEYAAWFVGFLELSARRIYFATLIDRHAADVDVKPVRRRVTERILTSLGLLPPDAARAPSQ